MHYLSDNPVPLILLLVAAAVVALLLGSAKGRGIAGLCLFAAVGLFFLEQYLVSPSEKVALQAEEMLQNFKDRNVEAITSQISSGRQELVDVARSGLKLVDISESFHIQRCEVTVSDDQTRATARIRANGSVTPRGQGGGGQHIPTMWATEWKPEDGQWKLTSVMRLNPANGDEMGYFSTK